MLKWVEKIYIDSENLGEEFDVNDLKAWIDSDEKIKEIYLIISPVNPNNLFEIVSAPEIKKFFYRTEEISVYGVALGKRGAEELVGKITCDMLKEIGQINVKEFFE